MRAEEGERPRVTRRLDDDGVAGIDERPRDEVEALLRPVHDEERVGSAGIPRFTRRSARVSRSGR